MRKIRNCRYCGAYTLVQFCCSRCEYLWKEKRKALSRPSIADLVRSERRLFLRELYVDVVNRGFSDDELKEHIAWLQSLSNKDLEKYYKQRKDEVIDDLCDIDKEIISRQRSCHEDAWIYDHCWACLVNPDDYRDLRLDDLVIYLRKRLQECNFTLQKCNVVYAE